MVSNMNDLREAIELGKQRGISSEFFVDGVNLYCGAALQKFGKEYKAHVSIIQENKMAAEVYDVYFTRSFESLDEAINCIDKLSPIKVSQFGALKGQRLFDPEFNEKNER